MNNISCKCNAKINLSLDVTGKRSDGYHDVELIFLEIPLSDTVTVSLRDDGEIALTCDDESIPLGRENIAYRAAEEFFDEFGVKYGANIDIEKRIPHGAGLAGGSADAAGVLKALNTMLSKPFTSDKLMKIGGRLGADVPFCVMGGCAFGEGVGEILTPLPVPEGLHYVLVKPEESVSTAYVYQNLDLSKRPANFSVRAVADALKVGDIEKFYRCCGNVMEAVTAKKYPVISKIKEEMIMGGARASLMSGSGTTVFGIFDDESAAVTTADVMRQSYKHVYNF